MSEKDWSCAGCGVAMPNKVRACNCPSAVAVRGREQAWAIDPHVYQLSETIRTKLLGVKPEDQDVVLDDADYRLILDCLAKS